MIRSISLAPAIIAAASLAALIAGSASAETFRFPADRVNMGVWQVDVAMSIYRHPDCAGRWSVTPSAGLTFVRGGSNGGNLRGNPGRGSYDVALNMDACGVRGSDYIEPARTIWHKVVVY